MSIQIFSALILVVVGLTSVARADKVCKDAYRPTVTEQIQAGESVRNVQVDLTPELMKSAMNARSIVFAYHDRKFYEGEVSQIGETQVTLKTPDGPVNLPMNEGVADLRRSESATAHAERFKQLQSELSESGVELLEASEKALASGEAVIIRQEFRLPAAGRRILTFRATVTSINSHLGIEGARRGVNKINIRLKVNGIVEEVFDRNDKQLAHNEAVENSYGFTIVKNEFPARFDMNPGDESFVSIAPASSN